MTVLLAGTLLAGCTSAPQVPSDPCEATSCAEAVEPSVNPPPPRGTNLSIPEARYPVFQAADCETFVVGLEVPIEEVRNLVPPAFVPFSTVGDATGGILVTIHECARSLDDDTVFGPITIQTVRARVTPLDETWVDPAHLNFYVLEEATNSAAWNDEMALVGRSAATADMTQERHDLPDGSFVAQWTTSTDDWETNLDYPRIAWAGAESVVGYDMHLWYGEGPFHRMTLAKQGNATGLPAQSVLRASGDSVLSGMTFSPTQYLGNYFVGDNLLLQYDGAWTET